MQFFDVSCNNFCTYHNASKLYPIWLIALQINVPSLKKEKKCNEFLLKWILPAAYKQEILTNTHLPPPLVLEEKISERSPQMSARKISRKYHEKRNFTQEFMFLKNMLYVPYSWNESPPPPPHHHCKKRNLMSAPLL